MIRNVTSNHQLHVAAHTTTRTAAKTAQTQSFASLFGNAAAPNSSTATSTNTTQAGIPVTTKPIIAPSTPAVVQPVYVQGATSANPYGSTTALNPTELASADTAKQIAALLGGTVREDAMGGSDYTWSEPQRNIVVPGSANAINAGLAANLFARYGTAPGSQAWQIINRDLGRDPMSTTPGVIT
jgi:hypothetical protein